MDVEIFVGIPRLSIGTKVPAVSGIIGRFRTCHALDHSGPKLLRVFRKFFLNCVGNESGNGDSYSGEDTQEEPDERSPRNGFCRIFPVLTVGKKILDLGIEGFTLKGLAKIDQDLAHSKEAHGHKDQFKAVSLRMSVQR